MNSIYTSTINSVVFFKEEALPTLKSKQKRVILIALAIFCGLAACYTLHRYLKSRRVHKENISGSELKKKIQSDTEGFFDEIQDEVLGRHPKKEYPSLNLANYKQLNQALILQLEAVPSSFDDACNTGMTYLLADFSFSRDISVQDIQETNDFLKSLVTEALTYRNRHAQLALTRPNDPDKLVVDPKGSGFPQNTPLLLLIKGGNFEGVQHILPVYSKKDLLFTTPRRNHALHIAILTGQFKVAVALIQRAQELDCADEMLAMKNGAGKTAENLYFSLLNTKKEDFFMPFIEFADREFGGDELKLSLIHRQTFQLFLSRNRLIGQVKKLISYSSLRSFKEMPFREVINLSMTGRQIQS